MNRLSCATLRHCIQLSRSITLKLQKKTSHCPLADVSSLAHSATPQACSPLRSRPFQATGGLGAVRPQAPVRAIVAPRFEALGSPLHAGSLDRVSSPTQVQTTIRSRTAAFPSQGTPLVPMSTLKADYLCLSRQAIGSWERQQPRR